MRKDIFSAIFGSLFWVPIFGILFSYLAIILGLEEKQKRASKSGITLGIIGILSPIFFFPLLFIIFKEETLYKIPLLLLFENYGFYDILLPLSLITLFLFLLFMIILSKFSIKTYIKALISSTIAFLIAASFSVIYIEGRYDLMFKIILSIWSSGLTIFAVFLSAIFISIPMNFFKKDLFLSMLGFLLLVSLFFNYNWAFFIILFLFMLLPYFFIKNYADFIKKWNHKKLIYISIAAPITYLFILTLFFSGISFILYPIYKYLFLSVIIVCATFLVVLLKYKKMLNN